MSGIDFLQVMAVILTPILVFVEMGAVVLAYRNALDTTPEAWGAPITTGVRLKLFLFEWMWRSFFFADAMRVAYRVPNHPIRLLMAVSGISVGWLVWLLYYQAGTAVLGAGEIGAVLTGVGTRLALQGTKSYEAAKKVEMELLR